MMRKRTKHSNDVPKWKRSQTAARRKSPHARWSRKLPGIRVGGFARFIVVCLILGAAAKFVGVPIVHRVESHPVFKVREVVVEGARYIDSEKISASAGIEPGINIFDVDLADVAQTLKSEYTAENFTVFRRLPQPVVINVYERKPVALLNLKTLVGVDSEGVPLPHIGADMVGSLPIISGITSVSSLSDSTTKTRLISGLRMLDRISKEAPGVYSRISEVDVANMADMGISLVDNGIRVIIGSQDWTRKIPKLERVINEVTRRREKVKTVDIRFGDKVIVTK